MRDIAAGCAGIGIAALMLASVDALAQTGATTRFPQGEIAKWAKAVKVAGVQPD